jgi:pyruvate dehydrogenase E2 component (dihydrolipoamide acetyltransferase)
LVGAVSPAGDAADTFDNAGAGDADYETIVPGPMRRTIARRMLESVSEAPQYTVTIKADMTALVELKKRADEYFANSDNKISFNDFLVKCICAAVKNAPYINGQYISDSEIRLMKHVSVGIAVALTDGLVVPVIRNADLLSLGEIAVISTGLIEKARNGTLSQDETGGGTITLSNMGMYGINNFTALINRPESAILAVGAIVETPVAADGRVTVRPIMDVTASVDHRLIDGGTGALFMAALKKIIENPIGMI